MNENISLLIKSLYNYLPPLIVALFFLFLGIFLRKLILNRIFKKAKQPLKRFEKSIKDLFVFLFFIFGIYISTLILTLNPITVKFVNSLLSSITIIFITIFTANFSTFLIKNQKSKLAEVLPSTSIVSNIVKITILIFGGLLLLQNLGISITPILTALGVGGLAIALALQDTLSNLFAGIQIMLSKNIQVNDYVELSSGENGFVQDINWRNTIIKDYSNNYIIIPNNKLSSTIIKNNTYFEAFVNVYIDIGISYDSDLDKVEKICIEEANKIIKDYSDIVTNNKPIVRFKEFGDSSINLFVRITAKTKDTSFEVKHLFIKNIYKRFEKEGIVIPYPHTTVELKNNKNKE